MTKIQEINTMDFNDCGSSDINGVEKLFKELAIKEGYDPEQLEKDYQAKLQAKADDYCFALNQILGSILDRNPHETDSELLERIEKIAKHAFDYDKEE